MGSTWSAGEEARGPEGSPNSKTAARVTADGGWRRGGRKWVINPNFPIMPHFYIRPASIPQVPGGNDPGARTQARPGTRGVQEIEGDIRKGARMFD